jgi:hypothetical protein
MSMEHWWNSADNGNRSTVGEVSFQCHFVHHKSHTYLPGVRHEDFRNIALECVKLIGVGHGRMRRQEFERDSATSASKKGR